MKHVFIINPAAGRQDCTAQMLAMAKKLGARHGLDVSCVLTKSRGHAAETVRRLVQSGAELRVYACGGDGTVNEVANAVAGAEHAAMTCVPVGTGNDFLKNFGRTAALFADAENLWDGPEFDLDAIDCNGHLALTVACSGFDAQVAEDVHKYGKLLSGKSSYLLSLAVNFMRSSFSHWWTVWLDGERIIGDFILAVVCNGRYYGGGFVPAAEARMDDGVLNTVLVRRVSRPAFLRMVGDYAKGRYYQYPEVALGSTAREIVIESPDQDIITCLDGESVFHRNVTLRLSEKKVRFFGPQGCDPNATWQALPGRDSRRSGKR